MYIKTWRRHCVIRRGGRQRNILLGPKLEVRMVPETLRRWTNIWRLLDTKGRHKNLILLTGGSNCKGRFDRRAGVYVIVTLVVWMDHCFHLDLEDLCFFRKLNIYAFVFIKSSYMYIIYLFKFFTSPSFKQLLTLFKVKPIAEPSQLR